jgi:hypothetical protein
MLSQKEYGQDRISPSNIRDKRVYKHSILSRQLDQTNINKEILQTILIKNQDDLINKLSAQDTAELKNNIVEPKQQGGRSRHAMER